MNNDSTSELSSALLPADEPSLAPLVSMADFDEADYRPLLDGLELTDEQASELLRILWDMMRMCIEMDMSAENWGQIVSPLFLAAATEPAAVE